MKYLWYILELFHAWRRNERRLDVPVGARGRVFQRKVDDGSSPSKMVASSQPRGYISARIIRADGTVEDLGIIAEAQVERV
jgi:hypothetical protein